MHRTTPPDPTPERTAPRAGRRARPILAIGTAALAAGLLPIVAAPEVGAATAGYSRFTSCTSLVTHLRNLALPLVGPNGLDGNVMIAVDARVGLPAASPAATTGAAPKTAAIPATAASAEAGGGSSSTNVQEAGVDEGDTVENDGRYLYSGVTGAVRIVDTTTGKLVATLTDPGQGGEAQLLLDGPRLAVVRQQWTSYPDTTVEVYDVRNPAAPNLLRRLHYEGTFQAVRAVDHRLRLVLQTSFQSRLPFVSPTDWSPKGQKAATEANKRIVRNAKANDWLPRFYDDGPAGRTAPRAAIGCTDIGRPASASGLGLTWIATVDLDRPGTLPDAQAGGGVVNDGGIVYASATRVFVATVPTARILPNVRVGIPMPRRASTPTVTTIHAFDLGPGSASTWVASGTVKGRLLNQFSMSEKDGRLRVATTGDDEGFGSPSESSVHVLSFSGRTLRQTGLVTGLGRTERIYAVRFIGDLGYVVTFRQTDPLYVIDLRDPARPRVAGELKIPGYSAYLHPVGDGLLLGIGQDASDEGRRLGTQVSLFDVRDPNTPKQLTKLRVGGSSEAEYDHHAFLWWAPTGTLVIPISAWPQSGASVLRVDLAAAAITLRGRIAHPVPSTMPPVVALPAPGGGAVMPTVVPTTAPTTMEEQIRRSLVIAGRLVTVSESAVRVSDLGSLASQSYVRFTG